MKKIITIITLVFCSFLLGQINIIPRFTIPSELNGWEYDYYLSDDLDEDGTKEIYGIYNSETSLKLIRFELDGSYEVFKSFDNDLRLERGEFRKINGVNHFICLFGYRFGNTDGNDILIKIYNLETEELVQNVKLEDNYDRNWDINYINTQSLGDSTRILLGMECYFQSSNYQASETFIYSVILTDSLKKEEVYVSGGDMFLDYPEYNMFLSREENVYNENNEFNSYFDLVKHEYTTFAEPEVLLYECRKMDIYSSQYAEDPFTLYVIETNGEQELLCRKGDQSSDYWFFNVESSYDKFFRFPVEVKVSGEEGYILYNNVAISNTMFFEIRSIETGEIIASEATSNYYFGSLQLDESTIMFTAPGNGTPGVSFHELNIETLVDNDDNAINNYKDYSVSSYPNPFNSSKFGRNSATNIKFSIPESSMVNLTVYNVKGQKIRTLTNAKYSPGDHLIQWNGKNEFNETVSSGIYFYKLSTDRGIEILEKSLILK
jgi:hypothetical protein